MEANVAYMECLGNGLTTLEQIRRRNLGNLGS